MLGCQVVGACLKELAAQYNYVKFLKIASTECIPNYPDENLPTLLVYHDGQCKRTVVGTRSLGDIRISPESKSLSTGVQACMDSWPCCGLLEHLHVTGTVDALVFLPCCS